jgi:hypothetical protein
VLQMLDHAAEGLRRRFAQPLYVDIMVTRTVNNCSCTSRIMSTELLCRSRPHTGSQCE